MWIQPTHSLRGFHIWISDGKVEFGLIQENGNYRILGAGLLSAPDEMEYAMSDCPNKPEFDPKILAKIQFDDTSLQDLVHN